MEAPAPPARWAPPFANKVGAPCWRVAAVCGSSHGRGESRSPSGTWEKALRRRAEAGKDGELGAQRRGGRKRTGVRREPLTAAFLKLNNFIFHLISLLQRDLQEFPNTLHPDSTNTNISAYLLILLFFPEPFDRKLQT